jgi:hypothetical protein
MTGKKFRLGYAPTRRVTFSKEEAGRFRKLTLKKIKQYKIDVVDIDWLNDEGLLFDMAQVNDVFKKFRHEFVDAVFVPHVNFGSEDAVAKLGKMLGVPLLLWGPRDDAPGPDGLRLRDTQCGLFATSKVLRRMNGWMSPRLTEVSARSFRPLPPQMFSGRCASGKLPPGPAHSGP